MTLLIQVLIAVLIASMLAVAVVIRPTIGDAVLGSFRQLIRPIPAVLTFAAICALFVGVLHPWFMNWGSTSEEQAMVLPGDSAPPSTYFTRAITVSAPVSAVWPWLLAIGQVRAGFLAFGWRWLAPYLLVACGVALVLLLAPDSYAAFGLIFLAFEAGAAVALRQRIYRFLHFGPGLRTPLPSGAA